MVETADAAEARRKAMGLTADAVEARKKFVKKLEYGLLDYRHHALPALEKVVEVLLLLCKNVLDEPENARVRRVRASNKRIATAFSAHPAALELLQICGWHSMVEQLERYWIFEAPPGSKDMELLHFAVEQLQKALEELQAKQKASDFNKKAADAKERDKVLRCIEADRLEREERIARQQLAASTKPAAVEEPSQALV